MQKIIFVILTILILGTHGDSWFKSSSSSSRSSSSSSGSAIKSTDSSSSSSSSSSSRSFRVTTYSRSVKEYVICVFAYEFSIPLHGIEVEPLKAFEEEIVLSSQKIVAMPRDEIHAEYEILVDKEGNAVVVKSTGNSHGDLETEDKFVFRPVARQESNSNYNAYPYPYAYSNPCASCVSPCTSCPYGSPYSF